MYATQTTKCTGHIKRYYPLCHDVLPNILRLWTFKSAPWEVDIILTYAPE